MDAVIFKVDNREYAVGINEVINIKRPGIITQIPDTVSYVAGVMTYQGKVVTLISLRKKLGLADAKITNHNRVIISEVHGHFVGFIVDEVPGVIKVQMQNITEPDEMLKEANYITGIIKIGDRIIFLIKTELVLRDDDRNHIANINSKVEVAKT